MIDFYCICSCYFCGQKFILPQELSRHIRDKVCKADEKTSRSDLCHDAESLNPLSLLELPIVTEISQDDEVKQLMVASDAPTTSADAEAVDSLVQDDYVVIEHGAELGTENDSHPKDHGEHSVLWGCKQCDFRFV